MFDKWAIALLAPLGTALFLGVLALLLAAWRRHRLAWWLGAVALGWVWLCSLPVVSIWGQGLLESAYPPVLVASVPAAPAAVVLGGAMGPSSARQPFPELHQAADRVWHAARLYHAGKAPLLVLSGGGAHNPGALPEAEAMRLFLRDLGVPDSALLLENHSGNTRQNASMSAALLKQRGISSVLLVTSATHMARAKADFEAAGLQVVPAATDYQSLGAPSTTRWLPSAEALDASGRVIKEVVGRWALGRIKRAGN